MVDTPIRKFMFDQSFDGAEGTQRAPARNTTPVTLKPEQLETLKKEAYDSGYKAGCQAGSEDAAQSIGSALTTILSKLDEKLNEFIQDFDVIRKAHDQQLRSSILAIARKLLPDYTTRHGLTEIQAMLNDVIAEMIQEPRLVVRIHESEFDAVNTKIHEITVQKAYAGKVVVLADAEITTGDCRIEWADGGIERNVKSTWNNIEDAVDSASNKPEPSH